MIEIDLLPLELRKRKRPQFEQFFKIKFIYIGLGCLVLFHLLLNTVTGLNKIRLNKLKKTWQEMSHKKESIDKLRSELGEVDKKIPLIERLIRNRVLWSEKLGRINDLIISGLWLNELSIQREKADTKSGFERFLIIRGSAASRAKDEPALIGRFMQNLKDDHAFSADFKDIELGPIKKRQIAQTEIMDFVLICQFKPESAQTLAR